MRPACVAAYVILPAIHSNNLFLQVFYLSILILSRKVLSAPNVLRIGATENIFVECQECSEPEDVTIIVSNFPSEKYLGRKTVTLTETNKFQAFVEIKVWLIFSWLY